MSFAGVVQFKNNLDTLMESDCFKNADDGKKLMMGGLLLRSKYGAPIIGEVKELKIKKIIEDE